MSGVVIIDSGGANLASLAFALQRLGVVPVVSANPEVIARADHVLLPGVGSAGDAMTRLRSAGLQRVLPTLRQPVLGICLGMQMLFDASQENDTRCLGIIPGTVMRLQPEAGRPVPHMGWNTVTVTRPALNRPVADEEPLLRGFSSADYVYFVHSFYAPVAACTAASSDYGVTLSAVVRRGNFAGVQFHPERSSSAGARLLRNFLSISS